jgi:hypothetical protein
MRDIARALVLVVGLAVAANAFAASKAAPANSAPQAAKKTSTASTHTVKGTVKSIDNSTLVLTPKKGSEMTFALDTNTTRQGAPAAGSDVSVKYHTEGKTMMATAITAQPAKQVASAKPASSKKTTK